MRSALVVASLALLAGASVAATVAHKRALSAVDCKYRASRALPDPRCTSGATDPRVVQSALGIAPPGEARDNLDVTICKSGWAAAVRPPGSFTSRLKVKQMRLYGARGGTRRYQEDHLVPLELGGAARDPKNLWPMPIRYAHVKDRVEDSLHRLVCARKLSLFAAVGMISVDWRAALGFARWAEAQP